MPLIGPILDDRTFEQLRDELVKRIPVYAPEWTDHNAGDPGIALLELFAHLGESVLFRFNQIPDATKVAFLRLLGVRPRPALSARTLLVLDTERPEGVQVLPGTEARAGAVPFETDGEVVAWPLEVLAVGKTRAPAPAADDPARAATEQRRRQDAVEGLAPAERDRARTGAPVSFYVTTAVPADPLGEGSVPLDVATTIDQCLWIALLAKDSADPRQLRGRSIFLGVLPDEELPRPYDLVPRTPGDPTRLRAADLLAAPPGFLWELWNGPSAPAAFTPLDVLADTTRGLSAGGVVSLALPAAFPTHARGAASTGGSNSPPPLDDEKAAARVLGWLRVRRPAGENDAIHRIRWVGINAVGAVQARTATPEHLGTGTADAGQAFRLTQRPVIAGSVRLEVEEADGWRPWTEAESFAATGPFDRHYTLDAEAGVVRFAERGRLPRIGERIRVLSYWYGGGSAGNVPAGAVGSFTAVAGVKVTNPLPATGGADPASLADALDALPAEVHRRDRAVTAEDFRALALEVPGVRRAEPLPLLHPDTPGQPAAGVISVLVFPAEDLRDPGAPLPDLALLRQVAAYLNPRRLVTTELYVIPPTYVDIAVSVGIRTREGYQSDAVRRWVELILRQYLAPLPPYGPEGAGWPLGRAVRRAELEAVAVQVEGLAYIEDELLLARRAPGTGAGDTAGAVWTPAPLVALRPWEVPRLAGITVVTGSPLPVGAGYGTPPPPPGDPVVVPLPPEVC
ncbi:putative baseplate assembly protein [Streptomyces sp. NBC_00536]|uniref:putative baseplate assembly protein n=1 Tax=Streptomyces sp. NBC_00536 TaxID=2975769 RepID=UPI002E8079EF|nr:putative baseplate assembly protein [Streptomyces sp. NBC_00536]WUC82738.1 putative baseplate assembly protein [Streptomyces sp. NBC_00536]